eukprot:4208118-Amphidinium_carterae.1
MVELLPPLREFLDSEESVALTRRTISMFDCFIFGDAVSEYNLLNIESVRSLATPSEVPGASKVVGTLAHQCPEAYQRWTSTL